MSRTPWIMLTSSSSKPQESSVFAVAFISPRRFALSAWLARQRSSARPIGQTRGKASVRMHHTTGANKAASLSWLGPVKMADGTTSPKMSTTDTETRMAIHEGTSLSKNKGNASLAQALASSSVTSRAWLLDGFIHGLDELTEMCPEISGKMRWAYFWSFNNFSFSFALSSVLFVGSTSSTDRLHSTLSANSSNDVSPRVSPAARAAQQTQTRAPARLLNQARVPGSKTSSPSSSSSASVSPASSGCRCACACSAACALKTAPLQLTSVGSPPGAALASTRHDREASTSPPAAAAARNLSPPAAAAPAREAEREKKQTKKRRRPGCGTAARSFM
mmetsp:Transcript_119123/g.309156  ORF Transcript_119123/g.309156 Transcript_119123/m.309156 type:complete len:334 (+) Transcript_119123:741-1742(+)